jgi:hypothetical protein
MNARNFHAYCIGTSKSGTHSVAALFGKRHRAAHEPEYGELIEIILRRSRGAAGEAELKEFISSRDRRLGLELECSHPLFHLLDVLVTEFSEAKFILTIRDCYSWLDSQINSQLSYIETRPWQDFGDVKFAGETGRHPPEEQIFSRFGLYTLDGYLAAWAFHNQQVLTTVPRERLLVIRTPDIAREISKLAGFLGVSVTALDTGGAHSFKGGKKFDLLSKLDQEYLDEKIDKHCRPIMNTYFPELQNFASWKSSHGLTPVA